ncbi:MAG: hypothetical protein QGF53_03900 [Alphaproteobacteria bacterium]|nr:hypothetical protein [Alphaproteobacteria bacterium]
MSESDDDAAGGMPQVEVEVRLTDGEVYVGVVHAPQDVRVLDFMNDQTPFFALLEETGRVRILAKSQVVQVLPQARAKGRPAAHR